MYMMDQQSPARPQTIDNQRYHGQNNITALHSLSGSIHCTGLTTPLHSLTHSFKISPKLHTRALLQFSASILLYREDKTRQEKRPTYSNGPKPFIFQLLLSFFVSFFLLLYPLSKARFESNSGALRPPSMHACIHTTSEPGHAMPCHAKPRHSHIPRGIFNQTMPNQDAFFCSIPLSRQEKQVYKTNPSP
ncbi:hypothetical protein B0T22DRAFT_264074 [Podospora appendiculata]|uniref:Uncharacterized protein n=1 Tax=Podospora appendiculata TaxID=314037 RepID=A0AAE0X352_9PEZI|nr:hypothetical protein B0T22DRAFT_264074 [Podospora appendiculata]